MMTYEDDLIGQKVLPWVVPMACIGAVLGPCFGPSFSCIWVGPGKTACRCGATLAWTRNKHPSEG